MINGYFDVYEDAMQYYPNATVFYLLGRRDSGKSFSVKHWSAIRNLWSTGLQTLFIGRKKADFSRTWWVDTVALYKEDLLKHYKVTNIDIELRENKDKVLYYVLTTAEKGEKKPRELEIIGECWTFKDAYTFKRGTHYTYINTVFCDEIIDKFGQYTKGDGETDLLEMYISSLVRGDNPHKVYIFLAGNVDYNVQLCPHMRQLEGLDYDKLQDNSCTPFNTIDINGDIQKDNVVVCKVVPPEKENKAQAKARQLGIFNIESAKSSIKGTTQTNKFNILNHIEIERKGFTPLSTFKCETGVYIRGHIKHIYATIGSINDIPTLYIHKHDIYEVNKILSAFEHLNKPKCIYRMNKAKFCITEYEILIQAIETLQVFTEDDFTATTFFNIWAMGRKNPTPYFTI